MPREAPVTIAVLPVRSSITFPLTDAFLNRGEVFGHREMLHTVASLWIFFTRPLSTVPGPTSTYVVTPSDARRRTTASHWTGDDTCRTSASIAARASRFGSPSTFATTGMRGSATRNARNSGARRSSAGFISAQWNGALTGSGIARLAPSALARSAARCTAATAPAMTTCPAPLTFAGLTTSPCAASSHAWLTLPASSPRIAAIAPCPTGTASCM